MRSAVSRSSVSGRSTRLEDELPAKLTPVDLDWKIPLESIAGGRGSLASGGVNWNRGRRPDLGGPADSRGRGLVFGLLALALLAGVLALLLLPDERENKPAAARHDDGATGLPFPVPGNVPLKPAVTTVVVSGLPNGAGQHQRVALRRELKTIQQQIAGHHGRDDAVAFGRVTSTGVSLAAPTPAADLSQPVWPTGDGPRTLAAAIKHSGINARGQRRRLIAVIAPRGAEIDRRALRLGARDRVVRIDPTDGLHTRNGVARKLMTEFYAMRGQATRMGAAQ